MAARNRYVHSQVTQETYQGIQDAANLWGQSLSKAIDQLVQRGLISLDTEMGSKTPALIRLARIENDLNSVEGAEQRVRDSHSRAAKLQKYDMVKEIETVAKDLGIDTSSE